MQKTKAKKSEPKIDRAEWLRNNPELVRSIQLLRGTNDCFMKYKGCMDVGCHYWEGCSRH